jgi:hypothetical protein
MHHVEGAGVKVQESSHAMGEMKRLPARAVRLPRPELRNSKKKKNRVFGGLGSMAAQSDMVKRMNLQNRLRRNANV